MLLMFRVCLELPLTMVRDYNLAEAEKNIQEEIELLRLGKLKDAHKYLIPQEQKSFVREELRLPSKL